MKHNSSMIALLFLSLMLAGMLFQMTPSSADSTLTIIPTVSSSSSDYLNEFSYSNEVASIASTWQLLTRTGSQISVVVYSYCSTMSSNCVNVAFDLTDSQPLSSSDAESVFQAVELSNLQIPPSDYTNPFQSSVTCSIAAPQLSSQAANAGTDVGGKIADALPHNAGEIASGLIDAGKIVGLVDDANYPMLALGAVCAGSYDFEDYVSSQLLSCQSYLSDISSHEIYSGIAQDFVSCNTNALKDLNYSKYDPNVLLQTGETDIGNVGIAAQNGFQSTVCSISNLFGGSCTANPIPPSKSAEDAISAEASILESVSPQLSQISAVADQNANASQSRLVAKQDQATADISTANSLLQSANSEISAHTASFASFVDWFYTPGYNMTQAQDNATLASNYSTTANSDVNTYHYNSAITAANSENEYANAALLSANYTDNIPHRLNLLNAAIFISLIIIMIAGIVVSVRRIL